jgi:hypothetical protein
MTDATFGYELGKQEGRVYFLAARARPDFDIPEEFAVSVYYNDPETQSHVEIARIDTAHGHTHFDKLYRRDEPKERLDVDFWDAIEWLEDDWRTYATSYEQTH